MKTIKTYALPIVTVILMKNKISDDVKKLEEDNERLRYAINRIGFFFAGHSKYDHISKKCLHVYKGGNFDDLAFNLTRSQIIGS